jgi:hypothetical protein
VTARHPGVGTTSFRHVVHVHHGSSRDSMTAATPTSFTALRDDRTCLDIALCLRDGSVRSGGRSSREHLPAHAWQDEQRETSCGAGAAAGCVRRLRPRSFQACRAGLVFRIRPSSLATEHRTIDRGPRIVIVSVEGSSASRDLGASPTGVAFSAEQPITPRVRATWGWGD